MALSDALLEEVLRPVSADVVSVLLLHRLRGVAMVHRPKGDRRGETIILPRGPTESFSVDEAARRVLRRECGGLHEYSQHHRTFGGRSAGEYFVDPESGLVYACAVFLAVHDVLAPDPESGLVAAWVHRSPSAVSATMAGASAYKGLLALHALETIAYDNFEWPAVAAKRSLAG